MDDIDTDDLNNDGYVEDVSYQSCYRFRSAIGRDTSSSQANKRRKLSHDNWFTAEWPVLSATGDCPELANQRKALLVSVSGREATNSASGDVDRERIHELLVFVDSFKKLATKSRLPAALILTGLDRANFDVVCHIFSNGLVASNSYVLVEIQSRQCPNLQAGLRNLVKNTLLNHSSAAAYNELLAKHKRLLPLNFDLELLESYIAENSIQKLIVSIPDVENFDASTANDLINTLHLWRTRIPCVLLLGITSTRDLFEQRLSKTSLMHLDARAFDFASRSDRTSDLLRAVQLPDLTANTAQQPFLSPNMIRSLLDLNQGQGNTMKSVKDTLQYLYMSHFLANPLSVLSDVRFTPHDKDSARVIADAARNTLSFRRFCEDLLAQKSKVAESKVKKFLHDNDAVLKEIREQIPEGKRAFRAVCNMIYSLSDLHQALWKSDLAFQRSRLETESQLYQAMDDLTNCQIFDTIRDRVLSLQNSSLKEILDTCARSSITALGLEQIYRSLEDEHDLAKPSIDVADIRNTFHEPRVSDTKYAKRGKSTKTTTNSARTSKQKLKSGDSVANDLVATLERQLLETSLDISSLLLHEAYVLSARTIPLKQNLESQPRAAVERALLRPGDYLTCDCCGQQDHDRPSEEPANDENNHRDIMMRGNMPPACILFTMLQEAPTIINVRDLYDAFAVRVDLNLGSLDAVMETGGTKNTMMLFYRALAELKTVGLVKASTGTQIRKRAVGGRGTKSTAQDIDFVAKTSWAGL